MTLNNQAAVITGASSGLGAAAARALAARGVRVALLARTRPALEAVAAEIQAAGGLARVYPADLADAAAAERAVHTALADLGAPAVVVNSAGAGRWLATEETEPAEAVQMMAVPYFAAFYVTRACLPAMLARGRGRIVTINSPAARLVWPGAAGYTAARWALYGFTEALRADLHGTGLGVTSILCGEVHTPYFTHNPGTLERAPWLARRLIPALEAGQVAEALVAAVERGQREVVLPGMLRVFLTLHAVAPRLTSWLAVWSGWQHSRRSHEPASAPRLDSA
ncbi:MAG: SDR family oxidoreductase [Anaerolineales bacterium]|nr:SDR family oxidoreductase [Anaerolineales bacterium]